MENSVPSGAGHGLAVICLQYQLTADVGEVGASASRSAARCPVRGLRARALRRHRLVKRLTREGSIRACTKDRNIHAAIHDALRLYKEF